MVATATLLTRSLPPFWECMFRQQGTGLSLLRNAMNRLPLIKKSLCKKDLLHKAELILAAKPSFVKSSELNSRLRGQIARGKNLHQSELLLASRSGGCSAAQLNSRLAIKMAQAKRLHSAQMIAITK